MMLDLAGTEVTPQEKDMLRHPQTGGVILFSRNYENPEQISFLTSQIHGIRQPPLLIAVDQEGGRVQRFRNQFTRIPACRQFGRLYDRDQQQALSLAEQAGWLMASELLAVGVDFSFAPVLDLDKGRSSVIGDRAFHHDCDAVTELARAMIRGMRSAGMACVGKHFPGHGSVSEDSHETVPVDDRRYEDIMMSDLIPFERLAGSALTGIMPAHVIYRIIDDKPAGFSAIWLGEILRKRLGFQGAIFSDDISMAGAQVAGDYPARARTALAAGCDMVLICNNQRAAALVLDRLECDAEPATTVRLMRMHGSFAEKSLAEVREDTRWRDAATAVTALDIEPELDLDDDVHV